MPPRRVDWLKDGVPEQRTIVRRTPPPAPPQQQYGGYPAGTMFTGAGSDGIVQPGKMAGTLTGGQQVHEAEAVLPSGVLQNLTPEEFQAFLKANEQGSLNKNAFRQSIGLPPVQGFQTGTQNSGLESGTTNNSGALIRSDFDYTKLPDAAGKPSGSPVDYYTRRNDAIEGSVGLSDTQSKAGTILGSQSVTVPAPTRLKETSGTIVNIKYDPPTITAPTPPPPKEPSGTTIPINPPPQTTPVVEEPNLTSVTAAPTNQVPASVGTLAAENVRTGLQNLKAQMGGMTESDKRIANYYLTNTDSNNAANIQVLMNQISSDKNLSESGKRMALAGLLRDASSSRATITQGLAQNAITRADQATDKAISTGQQVRTYEDVTLPAEKRAATLGAQTIRSNASDAIDKQITLLMAETGATADSIKSNDMLKSLISEYYGGTATPEQIDAEVNARVTSWRENGLPQQYTNLDTLMEEAKTGGQGLEASPNYERMRSAINNILGGNATEQQITDRLNKEWADANKKDWELLVDDIVDGGSFDEFVERDPATGQIIEKYTGVLRDLERTVKDLEASAFDEDGNIRPDAVISWPWDNPQTRFKYVDWNGEYITSEIQKTQPVMVNGKVFTDQNGMSVTNAAATEKWNSLTKSERDLKYDWAYNDETRVLDTEKLMNYMFPKTTEGTGYMNQGDFARAMAGDEEIAGTYGAPMKAWTDSQRIPEEMKVGGFEGIDFVPEGEFVYYDSTGTGKAEAKDSGKLAYIYYQLSQEFNKGEPIPIDSFNSFWKNGMKSPSEKWYVDNDGKILNLTGSYNPISDNKDVNTIVSNFKPSTTVNPSETQGFGTQIPDGQAKVISSAWDQFENTKMKSEFTFDLESTPTVRYEGTKNNRWVIDDANNDRIRREIEKNKGKLWRAESNGRIYEIIGIQDAGLSGHETASIILRDVSLNEIVYLTNKGGSKGVSRPLTGEKYE